ncbi:MAG: alkaline phosphatase family protein, partial [Lentisphaeria bacterium]|nr:alkaline phosphatase family protein [Lentisphaeria bacterium]
SSTAVLHIAGQKIALPLNAYTDWITIRFRLAPGFRVNGVCRFHLISTKPFTMYCTPVQIDPDKPVMPISHPTVYSNYLARLLGKYSTLGLAEDTWSLSEGVLDEDAFLTQAYDIHEERERMLIDSLDRVRRGMVACVFDAPDRIQHMFWRFIDNNHPALAERPNTHPDTIRDMYRRMDETVGKVMERLDEDTTLIVMSDHGFKPFRRGLDLNAWLLANDYLKLKGDAANTDSEYLADVDWTRTRAYAIGLAGIYVNRRGREAQGIVAEEETESLIAELAEKLTGLVDTETGDVAVHEAIPGNRAYRGPYVDAAPDLIIGYTVGYRVAWDAAVGKCGTDIFAPNTNAWSGDHCVHPDLVPGVLFSSIKLKDDASIIDVGPTTLELLGVARPGYMDGESLLCDTE